MNYKKSFSIFAILLLASVFVGSLVSAYSWQEFNTDVSLALHKGVAPTLELFIGKTHSANLFSAGLMLILVVLIIYGIISPINIFGEDKKNEWISLGVAIIVAILGVRWLPDNFISTLATPSSALVAILVGGIPLLILFRITTKLNLGLPISRGIWVVYSVLLVILGFYNIGKVNAPSIVPKVLFVIAAIAFLIALLLRWIRRAQRKGDDKEMENEAADMGMDTDRLEIIRLKKLIAEDTARGFQGRNVQREKRINALEDNLSRLENKR